MYVIISLFKNLFKNLLVMDINKNLKVWQAFCISDFFLFNDLNWHCPMTLILSGRSDNRIRSMPKHADMCVHHIIRCQIYFNFFYFLDINSIIIHNIITLIYYFLQLLFCFFLSVMNGLSGYVSVFDFLV